METVDYASYIETLRTHVEALRQTPPFDVLRWKVYRPMRDTSIQQMETYVAEHQGIPKFHVLPAMPPFYRVANGFELAWIYRAPSPITGYQPVGRSILSVLSALYAPVDQAEKDVPYDEGYRLFDSIDTIEEVVLKFQRGVDEPAFYLHHVPSDTYHPLALDFPTYMDLLLQTRALYPWQQFFVTTPGFRIDEASKRSFFDNLERLFPDADASRFHR